MNRQRGFSWIELLVVLAIMAVIASIAIPRLHEAEISGNESAAASSIRTIVTAQVAFYVTAGRGYYSTDLTTLSNATLIDSVLASGIKEGYSYTCSGSGSTFTVTASPLVPGETGRKYYYADQSGVIRFSSNGPATAESPALGTNVAVLNGSTSEVLGDFGNEDGRKNEPVSI